MCTIYLMIFPLLCRPARSSTVLALIAAVWICGFLWFFFRSSIEDPDLPRTELWSMMADEVLGLSDAPSEPAHTAPQSGIRFLSQRLPLFSWAAVILVLAAVHGDAICVLTLRRCCLYWTEQVALRLGIGLGILSTVTLCCGLAGHLTRLAIIIPAFASLAVSCFIRWKSRNESPVPTTQVPEAQRSSRLIRILTLMVIVPFGVYLLLGAVSPPTDFDVREYHLQGPKEWFQLGQIIFLPHNVYTSFPFLTEMLSLTGMIFAADWWHGALVGQVVLSSFQILSTLSIFSIARRGISIDTAWLAALIFLTTPWTLRISLIAYAEGALTFYLIAATMCALLVWQLPGRVVGISIITGLLAGASMASKYTGLISVILPTVAVIAVQFRKSRNASATDADLMGSDPFMTAIEAKTQTCLASTTVSRGSDPIKSTDPWRPLLVPAAAFSLGVAAMTAPWLLKNLIETGNPVYPLAYSLFGGSEWSPEMEARWKPAHAASEHQLSRIPEHILGAAVYNKWTSGLLFALAVPSVFLWRRVKTLPVILCLIVWGFATWWAFTHRIDRFWIPVIPLLSLAAGATWLISSSTVWKSFVVTVIATVTLFNVRFCGLPLVGFHVGLMDLHAARQTTIRSDIRYLNETLPPDARVLMVGEAEVFDATFALAYNTVFDECLFEAWTTLPDDSQRPVTEHRMLPPEQTRQKLRDHDITHIFVNWGAILRYRMTYGYTAYVDPARFEQLVDDGVLRSRKTLLQQPWNTLSEAEQTMVKSWRGYDQLIPDDTSLSVVELYNVTQP